ncbi:hypothetical protein CJJ09_004395 [Candidozyma auris]|nr:hypothetical protein CJJ09_004395 [[Candida] auris]
MSSNTNSALDAPGSLRPARSLRRRMKAITNDLPPELSPVVNLINAQRLRTYVSGSLWLKHHGSDWLPTEATLTGTELALFIDGSENPKVEIYTNDKINKKSLILYVNDVEAVYNVYPEDHRMIDNNGIMKLEAKCSSTKTTSTSSSARRFSRRQHSNWLEAGLQSQLQHLP